MWYLKQNAYNLYYLYLIGVIWKRDKWYDW